MRLGPSILFVDDDPDLCAVMQETCVVFGAARCITVGSLDEVERLGADLFACHLAILDINLGPDQPTGVEVFHWLTDNGFKGHVAFLTGHAHDDPRVRAAAAITRSLVLSKPVKPHELKLLIEKVAK